jgi:rare lipoprotein A
MACGMWMAAGLVIACGIAGGEASAQGSNQVSGVASYYLSDHEGQTSSGDYYNPEKFTAAHRTLPFGTHLRITDPVTLLSVDVIVNDRGPFTDGRMLDLSLAAATELHIIERGLIDVTAAVQ